MQTLAPELPPVSRKPRVNHHPAYVGTLGDIGADIMRRAGKPLDDWQSDGLDILCALGPDKRWACVEYCEMCPRQNGKGGILEARVLLGFLALNERLILWSAHEYKTALEAWGRVRDLLFALGQKINDHLVEIPSDDGPIMVRIISSHGKEGFRRLDTGQRIKFVARSSRSGRGMSGDLVIIDEAFAYTAVQQEAQTPVILAMPNPQIIYASTPPLTGDTGEVLYGLRERAEANDATLGYRDWGLAGVLEELEQFDLDDVRLWGRSNPALQSGRLTLAKMSVVKRSMRTSRGVGFARECLGIWPRKRKGVGTLDLVKWAALLDKDSRRQGDVVLAFDISPHREYAAIALYGLNSEGRGHMQILDYRPGTDWLVTRLAEWRTALNPLLVVAGPASAKSMNTELTNAGIVVPTKVEEKAEAPHRGALWVATHSDMSVGCSRMLDIVNQDVARHTGQDALDDAVRVAKTRQSGDGVAWVKRGNEGDVTSLVAVTLAAWAFEEIGPRVLADYELLDSIG